MEHKSHMHNTVLEASLVQHFIVPVHSPEDLKYCIIYKFRPHPYNYTDALKVLQIKEHCLNYAH